jgi:hypothetical protein
MGYVSRRYLNEKWRKVKWDMEKVLEVEDGAEDKVSGEDVRAVRAEIADGFNAIMKELLKA